MARTALAVQSRPVGKGAARRLRVQGALPAVLYGKGQTPVALCVDAKALHSTLHTSAGRNVLIDLAIDSTNTVVARVKEVQLEPLRYKPIHVDFQTVDLREKIVVEVPIYFEGKAPGVKEGGILETSRRSLEVRCLATEIPEHITVDISALNIGDSIHANDVQLPQGIEFPHAENFSVVQVVAPQKEEVAAVVAVAADAVPSTEAAAAAAAAAAAPAEALRGATPKAEKGATPKAEKK